MPSFLAVCHRLSFASTNISKQPEEFAITNLNSTIDNMRAFLSNANLTIVSALASVPLVTKYPRLNCNALF
jgi:hypothetical protein